MGKEVVSMLTRVEVSKQLRQAYRAGSKKEKGLALDTFQEATGMSRSTARRYLTSKTIGNPKVVRLDRRKIKPFKYSDSSRKVLTRVWRLMGMPRPVYGCLYGVVAGVFERAWGTGLRQKQFHQGDRGRVADHVRSYYRPVFERRT